MMNTRSPYEDHLMMTTAHVRPPADAYDAYDASPPAPTSKDTKKEAVLAYFKGWKTTVETLEKKHGGGAATAQPSSLVPPTLPRNFSDPSTASTVPLMTPPPMPPLDGFQFPATRINPPLSPPPPPIGGLGLGLSHIDSFADLASDVSTSHSPVVGVENNNNDKNANSSSSPNLSDLTILSMRPRRQRKSEAQLQRQESQLMDATIRTLEDRREVLRRQVVEKERQLQKVKAENDALEATIAATGVKLTEATTTTLFHSY
eukprot:PhM_4_TR11418/c0_g1_i1/m.19978